MPPDDDAVLAASEAAEDLLDGRLPHLLLAGLVMFSVLVWWGRPDPPVEHEALFWLFAASAQAVATLFAFLLAGYALSSSRIETLGQSPQRWEQISEGLEDPDQALERIKDGLKERDFDHLTTVSVASAVAVVLSLAMLLVNPRPIPWKLPSFILAGGMTVLALVLAVLLVSSLADPKRPRKVAQYLLQAATDDTRPPGVREERKHVSSQEYFGRFVQLERDARRAAMEVARETHPGLEPDDLTFGRSIHLLREAGELNERFFGQLREANRIRNLVVHGHVDQVDQRHLDHVGRVHEALREKFLDDPDERQDDDAE